MLAFIAGLILGGGVTLVIMCCLTVASQADGDEI